jgi:hypothetical protein
LDNGLRYLLYTYLEHNRWGKRTINISWLFARRRLWLNLKLNTWPQGPLSWVATCWCVQCFQKIFSENVYDILDNSSYSTHSKGELWHAGLDRRPLYMQYSHNFSLRITIGSLICR